jgi:bifunctional UDP-N-acetylglucosamine pyrophosphorylase/glucosamine-1-phosphate N-acetyltransferase
MPLTNLDQCSTRHAVILVAGESRRTRPLTLHRPKPLIPLVGQPLLAHILDELVGLVAHVTLVVGYRAADIQAHFGADYRGMELRYVPQQQVNGTASALQAVAGQIDAPFFLLYGDNLISRVDLDSICQERYSLAALRVADPQAFGILEIVDNHVQRIIEKPPQAAPDALANPGIYHFDAEVFPLLERIQPSPRGEYELTDLIALLAAEYPVHYHLCAGHWVPVGTPWEALIANTFLLEQRTDRPAVQHPAATIAATSTLNGAVAVGQARIGAGSRITGPAVIGDGVVIGANTVIERSVLAAGVTVGANCVIEHTMLGADTVVGDDCLVQHSLLDTGARLGTATRLPSCVFADVQSTAQVGDRLDSEVLCRRGAVLGPGVTLPVGSNVEPGSVVFPTE